MKAKTIEQRQSLKAVPESITADAIAETRKQLGFKEVITSTGRTLHISETQADYAASKNLLAKAKLAFVDPQKVLSILMDDEKLKKASLKGKWFYVAGKGLNKKLELYTINENGKLVKKPDGTSIERSVRVFNGNNPLSLYVGSDDYASGYGRRFYLDANYEPLYVAPVVVGVSLAQAEPKHAAVPKDQKQLKELLREVLEIAPNNRDTLADMVLKYRKFQRLEKKVAKALDIKG